MASDSDETTRALGPGGDALATAIHRAATHPLDEGAWDALEELAASLQRPEDVAELYRQTLKKADANVIAVLGPKALSFHEEWFGDTPEPIIELLESLLAIDPTLEWAAERLTLLLSVSQRWEQLLTVYDGLLAQVKEGPRRRKLLEEAAGVAKDFLGSPDRAIAYLSELFRTRPTDQHVAASLERLLDKEQRFAELQAVWVARLDVLSGAESNDLRTRLANLRLDHLNDVTGALSDAQALLKAREDDAACKVLERILKLPSATAEQRQSALGLLRNDYERLGEKGRIVEALETAHEFASGDEKVRLLREAAERLVAQNDNAQAMDRLVELLALSPTDAAARVRLHQLAEIAERFDVYLQGLLGAADATTDDNLKCALWLEAGRVQDEISGNHSEAASLFARVANHNNADQGHQLTALRRMVRLHSRFGPPAQRLAILERLAQMAPEDAEQQATWGQAGKLASQLGDDERAIFAWESRLALDGSDIEALDALAALLLQTKSFERLADVLRARAEQTQRPENKRADLIRLARLRADELSDAPQAIETWQEVERRFGQDAETTQALVDLLSAQAGWEDLAERLQAVASQEQVHLVQTYVRLAEVLHLQLEQPETAAAAYAAALTLQNDHPGARAGLQALLQDKRAERVAVDALAKAYSDAGDVAELVTLTEQRLATMTDSAAQARMLVELAERVEGTHNGEETARALLAQALLRAPENARLETELLRLCADPITWDFAATVLAQAAGVLSDEAPRKAQLLVHQGRLLETKLDNAEAALAAYEAALRLAPDRNDVKLALVRMAAATGNWAVAAEAVLRAPVSTEVVKGQLLPALENAVKQVGEPAAWLEASDALAQVISKRSGLPEALVRDLELAMATWCEGKLAGAQGQARAEAALLRAAKHSPSHAPTWERLALLQRQQPGRPLYETLVHLASLQPQNLDPGSEALRVAQEVLNDAPTTLQRAHALLAQTSHMLRTEATPTGTIDLAGATEQAVTAISNVCLASGQRQDAARAINVMIEVTQWNLPSQLLRGLRRKAARITLESLGDKSRARTLYRAIVDDAPDDREAVRVLAGLLEEADLLSELVALRRRELMLPLSTADRLALRLEMSRVAGLIEERSARVATLLANLDEAPGDGATLNALTDLLSAKSQFQELADILTSQARTLEDRGATAEAAPLWGRVAVIAEKDLKDSARAISGYEKMVALSATPEALDALARLCLAKGESRAAATWLEQRLTHAAEDERVDVSLRLSQAYLDSGQRHRGVSTLEHALAEAPGNEALRALLLKSYRQAEAWEPLARTLAEGCQQNISDELLLTYAREAAALYQETLKQPDRAVPVLELAVARLPGDRQLRTRLAEGLRVAGRQAEARTLLESLLEDMGRRRSKERAAIHHQLALAARADGDLVAALEHLDQASAIDVSGQQVLVDLAETAEQAKSFDRAERAYQALLVLARRSDPAEAPLSAGETLLRLEAVAESRNDSAAAAERLDSAIATGLQSPEEAKRLQATFVARGQVDRALSLLEKRASAADSGAEEARVMCDKARLFEALKRTEDAMASVAQALDKAPDLDEAHDLGRNLAGQLGDPMRYLRLLEEALDQMRRRDDGTRVCDLLMRAGAVAEEDLKDAAKAAKFYARAEQTGHHLVGALIAQARVAVATGEAAEEARTLRELARLAQDAESVTEQADISFRLAALQLRTAQTRVAGLETLSSALDKVPDFARAQAIVRQANVPEDELPRVMPLYERVARASGDDQMLLDFLERRAASKDVTQAEVNEGVELALALGAAARAETLLERAVALAQQQGQMREAGWALLDLAQRRKAQGDFKGAFKWLVEAAQATDSPRIPALLREVAREAAQKPKSGALAAEVYEYLRARNPADKDLWQPLIELYGQLNDETKLRAVVADTLEKLLDRQDRIRVRLVWARHLLSTGKDNDEAGSAFRDILLEEPGHREALMALAEVHERQGDVSEAVALLSEALREAEARGDADWQAATSRSLGDLLRKADPAQAKQVYRQALSSNIPDPELKRSLQNSLLDLLAADETEERARLAEELLAGESGEAAAQRALQAANLYRDMGDQASELRLLQQGRLRAPDNGNIFDRLAALFESLENWDGWAALMDEEASRRAEASPQDAADILRRAAATRKDKLADTAGAAALLKKAALLGPANIEQVRELAVCLREMGDSPGAVVAVGEALSKSQLPDDARVALLRLRADLHTEAGNAQAAVTDLETVYELVGLAVAEELTDALFLLASRAAEDDDLQTERRSMLRLTDVFSLQGNGEKAQELLFRWVDNHPEDKDALQALRGRFETAEQWEEVARVCERLVAMETDEGRIEAALGLAHAYEQMGTPAQAVPTLERVLGDHPGQPAVLNILSSLYEQSGNRRKVAEMRIEAAERIDNEEERLAALTEGADMFLQEGDPEAAVDAINKAFALRPEDRVVQRLLADTLLATGQYAQAMTLLDRLVADAKGVEGSELAALYHRMARAAAGIGDSDAQLAALRKALDSDRRNGVVASELADLAEALGDDDLALKALRAISLNCPDGPMPVAVSFYRQARIAAKNGDRQRALIFAKRALQEDPTLADAEQLLEQVR